MPAGDSSVLYALFQPTCFCRPTSPQLQCWLFFGTASKFISFPDHFFPNCFWFLSLYTVYSIGLAVFYLSHSK